MVDTAKCYFSNMEGNVMRRLLTFLVMLMLVAALGGCGKKEVKYTEVKAAEVIKTYMTDTGMGEQQYKGQNLQVTGQLVRKGQFKNSSSFYAVIAQENDFGRAYNVLVVYPVEQNGEINKMKYGDFIVAKGACVGIVPQDDPREISVQIEVGRVADPEKDGPKSGSSGKVASAPIAPPPPPPVPQTPNYPNIRMSDITSVYESSADVENNYVHSGARTIDGDITSCWADGVPGQGIGEYIAYNFRGTYQVNGLTIWAGHHKTIDLFYKNSRPARIRVEGSDGSVSRWNLGDGMNRHTITFNQPVNVSSLRIYIEDVYPGSKWQDTCIAEVEFF